MTKSGKLGVAPLTSMFLFGSNQPSPALNHRPALHDSNGLSIPAGNGEVDPGVRAEQPGNTFAVSS